MQVEATDEKAVLWAAANDRTCWWCRNAPLCRAVTDPELLWLEREVNVCTSHLVSLPQPPSCDYWRNKRGEITQTKTTCCVILIFQQDASNTDFSVNITFFFRSARERFKQCYENFLCTRSLSGASTEKNLQMINSVPTESVFSQIFGLVPLHGPRTLKDFWVLMFSFQTLAVVWIWLNLWLSILEKKTYHTNRKITFWTLSSIHTFVSECWLCFPF